jgi:hypothetical protein
MLSLVLAAQIQMLVAGECLSGSRSSCSNIGCPNQYRYCLDGEWSLCPCQEGIDCNDGDPCTSDTLSGTSCLHSQLAAGSACDDGLECTSSDKCSSAGVCKGTPKTAGTACSDGKPCTQNDVCNSTGFCIGTVFGIDDGNPCTQDSCDVTGAVHIRVAPGTACSDSSLCTTNDQCDSTGHCIGTAIPTDDGNACTRDVCEPATGAIAHPYATADAVCSAATYFCHDKYGQVTRKIVCVSGLPCDTRCP